MQGRVYTLTATGIALVSTTYGTLLSVVSAAEKPFIVHSVKVTQKQEETSGRFRIALRRRSTAPSTSGSGTVAVGKNNSGYGSASFSATMAHLSGSPSLGTLVDTLDDEYVQCAAGYVYRPTPKELVLFKGTAEYFSVELAELYTITGNPNMTASVVAVIEEF